MGSFLSRRLNQPEEAVKKPAVEALRPNPIIPVAPAPAPAALAKDQTPAKETDAYGNKIPPKRRTTPRVAELRRQLRLKLLATPDEADEWLRDNPEHVAKGLGAKAVREKGLRYVSERIPILEERGLVARPCNRKGAPMPKKGVGITSKGSTYRVDLG